MRTFVLAAFFLLPAAGQDFLHPCFPLPTQELVQGELRRLVRDNFSSGAGLGNPMWAVLVNRDGVVCRVVYSGGNRNDQWPGSRLIAAQKANAANAFSLPRYALSTANLYSAVQPGGTLFGLKDSNPVNNAAAYEGEPEKFGTADDPIVGKRIGGINVFGGGLALFNPSGTLIGGIGLSGDTSCMDHILAWRLRFALNLDNVPAGPAGTAKDNILHDLPLNPNGLGISPSGFGHPVCSDILTQTARELPNTHPLSPLPPQ
jgi:uncharacterized protein GlcG (DUF336 family)